MDPAGLRTPGMTAIRANTALTSNGAAKTAATASGVGTGITTTGTTAITITITTAASAMAGVRMAGAEAGSIEARWG
jgi:hypothetical protein